MPRLTALRIGPLDDLARQLRFAPRPAVLRHIRAAESISAELEPDRIYPLEWLVHALTGYRADAPEDDADVSIVGAALRAELSAFVERLSHQAGLTADDLDDSTISLEELCRRWGVNRKTIERRRREGLIGRRIRGEEGRGRLVFASAVVERFEHDRTGAPQRPLVRMDDAEKTRIIRRAERYHARFGCSLNQAAARLAERTGRGRETIRRLLLAHDRDADEPIFEHRPALTTRDHAIALRARRRGLGFPAIARGMGWTLSTAQRAVQEGRAEALRTLDLDAPMSPVFQRSDARGVLLAPLEVSSGLGAPIETSAAVFEAVSRDAPRPEETAERRRAAAACFLRWSARLRIEALPPSSPRAADLDAIETDLRWCALLVVELVRAHSGLALRTIEDLLGAPLLDLSSDDVRRAHRLAMRALIDAAWTFDPFRPGAHRLAGHAAGYLTRALARPLADARGRRPAGARRSHQREISLHDWSHSVADWQRWLDPPAPVRAALVGDAPPRFDRRIIAARYGWTPEGRPPMTCAEVGRALELGAGVVAARECASIRAALGLRKARIEPPRDGRRRSVR